MFVLGVPRSGTTLLQQLLAADERLFVTPDTFQVAHPTSFFTARSARERLVSGMLSERRPMDGVAQSFSSTLGWGGGGPPIGTACLGAGLECGIFGRMAVYCASHKNWIRNIRFSIINRPLSQ